MNVLDDVFTYMYRILKTASSGVMSNALLIDYVNRFVINDIDARIQLFDYKNTYSFQTQPGVDKYNMPLYSLQTESADNIDQQIYSYPVYQGFVGPVYVNGVQIPFMTQKNLFYNSFPNIVQNIPVAAVGNGTAGPYRLNLTLLPQNNLPINPPIEAILRGHVDISGIIGSQLANDPPISDDLGFASLLAKIPTTSIEPAFWITSTDAEGNNVVVTDSGIFLDENVNCGFLIQPGQAPYGNQRLTNLPYTVANNTINYLTGECTVTFNTEIPLGTNIAAQCFFFQTGLPRALLYYNNTITLRVPPARSYLVELEAYLSPAAFLNSSQAIQFGYMAEYIARGAVRKILSDTGDWEQFNMYEPLFKEQEMLVWKRSQRQWTATRTETIYSQGMNQNSLGYNGYGNGLNY